MSEQSKNEILNRIAAVRAKREAAIPVEYPVSDDIYRTVLPDKINCFKNELEAVNGKCVICNDRAELVAELKNFLSDRQINEVFCRDQSISDILSKNDIPNTASVSGFSGMKAGMTACEFLIARTGSVVVTSQGDSGRQMNVFPPVHIILASASQLVNFPEDALKALQTKYKNNLPSAITTITGPSRTADIEKTLVLGAHGPKELIVFLSVI